jgi:protein TonB
MPGAAAVNTGQRRGGALRVGLLFSLVAHVALLIWVYQWAPPTIRAATFDRIIPIFVAPRQVAEPPPPRVDLRPDRGGRTDAGGRSGQGMDSPAVPVRQPPEIRDPIRPLVIPPIRNPMSEAPTLIPSVGNGRVAGEGAADRAGPGSGAGAGQGAGVGQGSGPGGLTGRPAGWRFSWRRQPTGYELAPFYPREARAKGIEGRAILKCTVGVTGRVFNCTSIAESPAGMGFGQAAVAVSKYFRITPKKVDGKAIEAELLIPYNMGLSDDDDGSRRSSPIPSAPLPNGPVQAPPARPGTR